MSAPLGENVSGEIDFDSLLDAPRPTFELLQPKVAPADMLERVQVDTLGRCLRTDTPLGAVAVEMYWQDSADSVTPDNRGDFFPALDSVLDPEAGSNPLATQRYPYTILPDGALYEAVLRVPLEAVDTPWSVEKKKTLGSFGKLALGGVGLGEFRRMYPGVEVNLPEGLYDITATERTRSALALLARVENGEPLARTQEVLGGYVRYKETLFGGFMRSALHPETAVAVVNSRMTLRDSGQADRQRLEFKAHDGFQRTGEDAAEHSGLLELVVMQGEEVEVTDFTFAPHVAPLPRFSMDDFGFGGVATRGGSFSFGEVTKGFGGLSGGETRYRPPETVKVSTGGIRNLQAIAAFRFAMAGVATIGARG